MDKKRLNAVLVDDEAEALLLLEKLISVHENVQVTRSVSDPEQAVSLIISKKPDIVFLDVSMPEIDGFGVLDKLHKSATTIPYIVFTTAFDEFALKAFEYAAFDYLLKPIDPDRLAMTIERCVSSIKSVPAQRTEELLCLHNKLIYKNGSGTLIIDPSDIAYIEADGNYCIFKFKNGKTETVTSQLGKVENQLPADGFFRISRKYIINLALLKKIINKKHECVLQHNDIEFRCEIAKSNIDDLLIALNKSN